MTAQIPETIRHEAEQYDIVGVGGNGLIDARDLGVTSLIMSTGCWRGYYGTYAIKNDRLKLMDMVVGIDEKRPIKGITPVREKSAYKVYQKLHLEVPFTGGLLAGRNFIEAMYVHMGVQRPDTYEILKEFYFEQGNLISVTDYSVQMEAIRQKIQERRAWNDKHRAEWDEMKNLQTQLSRLESSIAAPHYLMTRIEDTIDVIRERLQDELVSLKAKIAALDKFLYVNGHDDNVDKWIADTFVLDYRTVML